MFCLSYLGIRLYSNTDWIITTIAFVQPRFDFVSKLSYNRESNSSRISGSSSRPCKRDINITTEQNSSIFSARALLCFLFGQHNK